MIYTVRVVPENLSKSEPAVLVLDTAGGSVLATDVVFLGQSRLLQKSGSAWVETEGPLLVDGRLVAEHKPLDGSLPSDVLARCCR